jgi:hypothetical protein
MRRRAKHWELYRATEGRRRRVLDQVASGTMTVAEASKVLERAMNPVEDLLWCVLDERPYRSALTTFQSVFGRVEKT